MRQRRRHRHCPARSSPLPADVARGTWRRRRYCQRDASCAWCSCRPNPGWVQRLNAGGPATRHVGAVPHVWLLCMKGRLTPGHVHRGRRRCRCGGRQRLGRGCGRLPLVLLSSGRLQREAGRGAAKERVRRVRLLAHSATLQPAPHLPRRVSEREPGGAAKLGLTKRTACLEHFNWKLRVPAASQPGAAHGSGWRLTVTTHTTACQGLGFRVQSTSSSNSHPAAATVIQQQQQQQQRHLF